LPAGLALVLLAGAALQLSLPQGAAVPPGLGVLRAPDRRLPAIAEVAAPDLAGRPSLFSPLRVVGARVAELDAASGAAPAPKPLGPLDGTFVLGSARLGRGRTLLLREESGRVLRLAPGGRYRGWQLLRIEADAALFRRGGRPERIVYGASAPAGGAAEETSESESDSE
jgi:hypothetical protein